MTKHKLIRITTVPISLEKLLEGQLGFMQQYFDVTAVSSELEALKTYAINEGVAHFFLDMTRKITPFKDLVAVWRLYKFLKKERPTIVHTHTPKAGIVGMLAARLANVPIRLHTVAGLPLMETTGLKFRILKAVEQLTYGCATMVYPNATGLANYMMHHQLTKPSKIAVLGNGSSNGIDTAYFDPALISNAHKMDLKKEYGISESHFVYIFVGRMVGDKGINELVSAFDTFSKEQTAIKLLLVGPLEADLDPLDASTMQLIAQNNNIKVVGYQQDVRPFLAIANVLVFPSYREGFPNVVMQAGAMGLPIIASSINGCDEIVLPHVNGILIPVKNVQATLQAMKAIKDPETLNTYQAHARPSIVSRYQRSTIWQLLVQAYNDQLMAANLEPLKNLNDVS